MALLHDDLKAMGITSVGHRLTILKSVYDVKKAQDVPIESDHYVPLCMSSPFPSLTCRYLLSPSFRPASLTGILVQPPTPRPSMRRPR